MYFGDADFDVLEEYDATWGEVFNTYLALGLCGVVFFLYFFLFSLELLGSTAKVMTGCAAGQLFGEDTNPVAGLMVGILATVLLQSSSTTTSILVGLTGSAFSTSQGIYMVMRANIGTTITNTIAIGQMGETRLCSDTSYELRRYL
jgi:sodium-dependent phosphate cotransporter